MSRMPAIPFEQLTEAQREAWHAFVAARGYEPRGPFVPLLRSPELLTATSALGSQLRFKSVLPPKLIELAILVTATRWNQPYEWRAHAPLGLQHGLLPDVVAAVAAGRVPDRMPADERVVYEFCLALHREGNVSDETFARAREMFGEQALIELVSLCGYYTLIAMVLNIADAGPQRPDHAST